MTRDSIHISMSEPLRRAQVRPRLQALADATGLPVALVGARALTIGLGHIERDPLLIFQATAAPTAQTTQPSPAAQTAAPPIATAQTAEPPSATAPAIEPPIAPAPAPELPRATASSDAPPQPPAQTAEAPHAHAPSIVEAPPATPPEVNPEPAPPRAGPPALVTAKVAAVELGHRDAGAFHSFVFRNQTLRRYSQKTGQSVLWDLGKLRAEYAAKGWKPRQAQRVSARRR